MLKKTYPYYLANEPVAMADAKAIDAAIGHAVAAQRAMREFKPYQRQAVLDHCVKRFRERFDELAEALCIEAGNSADRYLLGRG